MLHFFNAFPRVVGKKLIIFSLVHIIQGNYGVCWLHIRASYWFLASCATFFMEDGGGEGSYWEGNISIQYLVEFKNDLFLQKVDFLGERVIDSIFSGGGAIKGTWILNI